jgi:hypothetical protein
MSSTDAAVLARLTALETSNRRMKLGMGAMAAIALACGLAAAGRARQVPEVVEAHEFRVIGKDGLIVGQFHQSSISDGAWLRLGPNLMELGKPSASIMVDSVSTSVHLTGGTDVGPYLDLDVDAKSAEIRAATPASHFMFLARPSEVVASQATKVAGVIQSSSDDSGTLADHWNQGYTTQLSTDGLLKKRPLPDKFADSRKTEFEQATKLCNRRPQSTEPNTK